MKPRFSKQDLTQRLPAELRSLADLIDKDGANAWEHAEDFNAVGFPAGGNSEGGSSSDISDPTAAAVLANNTAGDKEPDRWKTDPTAHYLTGLRLKGTNVLSEVLGFRDQINAIEARAASDIGPDGKRRARPALGAGHCKACDRDCSGVGNDRLRGGLCDRCRKEWERNQADYNWDRVEFVRAKQAEHRLGTRPATS